jgi:hypothetical protein
MPSGASDESVKQRTRAAFEAVGITHSECVQNCKNDYYSCDPPESVRCKDLLRDCINNCPNTVAITKEQLDVLVEKLEEIRRTLESG